MKLSIIDLIILNFYMKFVQSQISTMHITSMLIEVVGLNKEFFFKQKQLLLKEQQKYGQIIIK